MTNTAINHDALNQLKPIAYFDPFKGKNAQTKSKEAKPAKAVAPKHKLVKESLKKPELDVTHQRMAGSVARKLKTMTPEEVTKTLSELDITPENFSEHLEATISLLGEEQSSKLVTKLLSDSGVTQEDLQKLQNDPEFQAAIGGNADAQSDASDTTQTLLKHMTNAFKSNPYLLVLSLGGKSSKMNFQVQGSALRNMQNVQTNMQKTTQGLNENVQSTKNEEAKNTDKHWWQKLLKIAVTVVVAIVIAVVINVIANVVLPGLGFALDGLIAAGAAALEIGAEVGVDAAEVSIEMTEMGEEVGEAAEKTAGAVKKGSSAIDDGTNAVEDSEGVEGEEVGDSSDADKEARSAQETLNAAENSETNAKDFAKNQKARSKLGKAVDELTDMVTKAKQTVSDTYESATNSIKESFKETKTGAKYFERDKAGKNIGKKASSFLLDEKPSTKAVAGFLSLGLIAVEEMVPASTTNAKVVELQTEANIMNLGMQSMNLSYQSDQQLVNTQDQNNQNVQMDESYALGIAKNMNTLPV